MPGAPRDPEGPSRPQNRADSVLLATPFHQGLLVKVQAEPCVFGQGQGRRLPDGPQPGQAVPGHRVASAGGGRGYGCASIAAPAARSIRKPLLRHSAAGCVVSTTGTGTWVTLSADKVCSPLRSWSRAPDRKSTRLNSSHL